LTKVTGALIQFEHIHGCGFRGCLGDMCGKQAHGKFPSSDWRLVQDRLLTSSGLGAAIARLDPRRTWQEHIACFMIYCLIHFERNIRQFQSHPLYQDIKDIPRMTSRTQVQDLFRLLVRDPEKKVRDWGRRYNCQLILGGLNKCYSQMDKELFISVQHHTNTLESIHRKTNQMGIHQSWLAAIKRFVTS